MASDELHNLAKNIVVIEGALYSDTIYLHTYESFISHLKEERYKHYQHVGRFQFYRHPSIYRENQKTEILFDDAGQVLKVLHFGLEENG